MYMQFQRYAILWSKRKVPHDEGIIVLQCAVRYHKFWFINSHEHMSENRNYCIMSMNLIEWIFEVGMACIVIANFIEVFL